MEISSAQGGQNPLTSFERMRYASTSILLLFRMPYYLLSELWKRSFTMDKTKYLPWVNFYTEFADKLRPFSGNRTHLVEKVKRVFVTAGMPLPKLEEDNKPILDVDPFTVFGLFNRGNSQVNRISIVKAFAQEFSVISPVPETFSGIPLLNNLNSLFYCFGEKRKSDDIDNLWKFFLSSLDYADNPTEENRAIFARFYDLV